MVSVLPSEWEWADEPMTVPTVKRHFAWVVAWLFAFVSRECAIFVVKSFIVVRPAKCADSGQWVPSSLARPRANALGRDDVSKSLQEMQGVSNNDAYP